VHGSAASEIHFRTGYEVEGTCSRIGKRGRVGNSRRREQTRPLTLCKHAVTTLVHDVDDEEKEEEENDDVGKGAARLSKKQDIPP